ncbi:cocaine- and amphetamine-regulated transcript protein [Monodelphis domestica]|uniref:Cocaine- and amphetamine-regulated transcript protein n=1 Tax=Monodelphis domestica TaxID=13616 RepID=F6T7Q6_MONDO|nr:cocaine- and amphetamine-regulated transcript protein [Monodelphis domestica]XP_056680709.1 cocaine- and amphetamine-regulated transcript protein [Monodelphis domestica]XP_056680710.1 cocaine- and amphetamine-regulated transcript protein [Monodelphis domestica]
MESSRLRQLPLLGATLLLLLLGACSQEDSGLQPRALDIYSTVEDTSHEKELIGALQEVLKKLKSKRIRIYEKKYGQVPKCDAGEQCAIRKGARIGKLCDCPRGTSCNSFLLKCL